MVRTRNLAQYAELHRTKRYGISGPRHRSTIQPWFSAAAPRTALDYGAGQSHLIDELKSYRTAVRHRYDPAIPELSSIPLPRYDLVVCTDVMEHLDETEVTRVLEHIASLGDKAILGISTRRAKAVLPTGENAHATVRKHRWWRKRIREVFPAAKIIVLEKDYVMLRTWRLSLVERVRHRAVRAAAALVRRTRAATRKAEGVLASPRTFLMRTLRPAADQQFAPPPVADVKSGLADPRHYLRQIDDPALKLDRRLWLWRSSAFVGPLVEFSAEELKLASNPRRIAMAAICAEAGHVTRAASLIDGVPARVLDARRYIGLTRSLAPLRPWVQERYAPELEAIGRFERRAGTFERLIRENAASLCIVGNSSCETGRGRGEEIDGHRLVIRFNNYSTDPGFRRDYGSKTDIWVRNSRYLGVWRRDFHKFRLVVFTAPLYWRVLNGQDIILDLDRTNQAGEASPSRLRYELRQKLGCTPSSGLVTLAWIHEILGSLRGVTVAGFSMIDQEAGSRHYYIDPRCRVRPPHDWSSERNLLDQLVAA